MSGHSLDHHVGAIRRFNRSYTRRIGVLRDDFLKSPYSLAEARVLYELAHRQKPTAGKIAAELGLDRLDRAVLDALIRLFGGGPVGLSTLAVAVAEEAETVEVVAEPFLVRHGLLVRTPRGRVATRAGWEHLGLVPPPSADTPTLFD